MKNNEKNVSFGGLIISSILMIVSIFMIILANKVYEITGEFSPIYIVAIFFIIIGFWIWYRYIVSIFIKPKEEILYLTNKEGKIYENLNKKKIYNYCLINKKGKCFYINTNKTYELNNFYLVLKTKNHIIKIIEISEEKFILPKFKESYWLNCYLPVGNFENIFLLPLFYFFVIFGFSLIATKEIFPIMCGIIMSSGCLYFIIYDFIYKIKKRQSKYGVIDDNKLYKSVNIYLLVIKICYISIIIISLFWLFIKIML